MAQASITSSREILDCPICLEQYHTPRSLPCLHTFCEECLDSYISSHVVNRTNFLCPVCRLSVTPPNPKSPAGTWAQAFPLNNLMVTLMDGGGETKDDACCTPCRIRDDLSVNASYWCNDCCEGLCEKCYTYHQQNKFCSKHKSCPIGEATVTINANADIDEDCPRHRGKILEVYCSDHSELCCVVCFATKHRECKQIHSIDEVSEDFNMDEVCSIFTNELNNIEHELITIASVKDGNIDKVGDEVKVITMDITGAVDKAKTTLDTLRDTLICDVKRTYEIEVQKLQHQHNQIRAFEKDVKNCSKVMASVTSGTRRQAFVMFEKMKSQLASHYNQLNAAFTNDVDVSLGVRVDTSLVSLSALNSLGKVDITEVPSGKTSDAMNRVARHLDKLPYFSGESRNRSVDLMDSEVRLVKVVNRKEFGLEQVDLAGGTFIHDGRLLIADFSAKNHRLILFDYVFGVATTLPVSGQPTDVAFRVNESDIFVCLDERKIINYSLGKGGNLIQKNELTTFRSVWNVAALDTVLITGGDNYIGQMDMDGAKLGEIEMSDGPCLLGKHDVNRTYYYADRDSVVCRKIGGEEVFRHDTGRPVDGVAVDHEGNSYMVYKSEGQTGGVYQVSHDGQRARVLVESLSAITDPYAVIFRQSKNMFVVTSDLEDTLLEVYEFIPCV